MQARKIRVLAVDHNLLLREGLLCFLESQSDIDLVRVVASGEEALHLFTQQRPDVVLMDLDLPAAEGIRAVREILMIDRSACVIGLLTHPEDEASKHALRAGARSWITKDRLNQGLVALIRDCPRR
jgi:DNA-binding NarL/FixJ family response regulator